MYPPAMDEDYARFHRDRGNMLIHIIAVPAFIYGTWLVMSGVIAGRLVGAVFGLAAIGVSLALQGIGHKREPNVCSYWMLRVRRESCCLVRSKRPGLRMTPSFLPEIGIQYRQEEG